MDKLKFSEQQAPCPPEQGSAEDRYTHEEQESTLDLSLPVVSVSRWVFSPGKCRVGVASFLHEVEITAQYKNDE